MTMSCDVPSKCLLDGAGSTYHMVKVVCVRNYPRHGVEVAKHPGPCNRIGIN